MARRPPADRLATSGGHAAAWLFAVGLCAAVAACRGGALDPLQLGGGSGIDGGGSSGGSGTRSGGTISGSNNIPTSPNALATGNPNTAPAPTGNANLPPVANPNSGPTTDPNPGASLGGASRCPATPVAGHVCDSFESAAVGAPPDASLWSVQVVNPTSQVTVDNTRAARGRQSVHIHTANGGYERAVIVNTSLFPLANNTFWGRTFFWLVGPTPQAHFTLIAGADLGKVGGQVTWLRYGGQFAIYMANWFGNDAFQHAGINVNGQWTQSTPVPSDRWVCLEWQLKGDTNEMHLWQDGVAISDMSVVGISRDSPGTTWTAPTYGQAQLGWEIYGNAGTDAALTGYDLWLDEVALSPTRIGCDG